MNHLDRAPELAVRSPLRAALHHAIVLAGGRDELLPLKDVVRDRFLAVHVLAGLHRPNRREGVPMIRRRHQHGVNVLVVKDGAHVRRGLGRVALFLLHPPRGFLGPVAVWIDHGGNLDEIDLGELPHQLVAAASQSDNGDAGRIVCSGRGGSQRSGAGRGKDKTTTVHATEISRPAAPAKRPRRTC